MKVGKEDRSVKLSQTHPKPTFWYFYSYEKIKKVTALETICAPWQGIPNAIRDGHAKLDQNPGGLFDFALGTVHAHGMQFSMRPMDLD